MSEDAAAVDEEYCPKREDATHCRHWWDCEPCCACGKDDPCTDEQCLCHLESR